MGETKDGSTDGLDIAPAPGQGEAYMVKDSSWNPIAFQRHYLDRAAQRNKAQRLLDQKGRAETEKWMQEKNPVVTWDIDQQNYFSKRLKDFGDKKLALVKKYNYNVPPAEMAALEREKDDFTADANMSKGQEKLYHAALSEGLKKEENGEPYYDASSVRGIQYYGDPKQFLSEQMVNNAGEQTTVEQELKKHGYDPQKPYIENQQAVYKFRTHNQHLLQPKAAYHITDRIKKINPLVPEDVTTLEQVGSLFGSNGKIQGSNTVKNTTPNRAHAEMLAAGEYKAHPRELSAELNDYYFSTMTDKVKNETVKRALIKKGLADKDGNLTPKVIALPAAERNALIEEAVYTEAFADMLVASKKKESSTTFAPKAKDPAPEKKKTFEDRYTVSVVPLESIISKEKLVQDTSIGPGSTWLKKIMQTGKDTTPYISIEPVGGKADTESLQLTINGKQVRPIGYKVKGGKVYMRASESQMVPSGKTDLITQQPIMVPVYKVTEDIPVENEVAGNVSAHYGFETFDAFRTMLETKAAKAGVKATTGKMKGQAKDYGL